MLYSIEMPKNDPAVIEVCTDPERAYFVLEEAPIYPAILRWGSQELDLDKDMSPILIHDLGTLAVDLVNGGDITRIDIEPGKLDRIAGFLITTPPGSNDYNCQSFAWSVCGIDLVKGPRPCECRDLKEADLSPGNLISIGVITDFMGLGIAEEQRFLHWGIYLEDGMTLNITGIGGVLAGIPMESFQKLYPGTTSYKVEGY